MTTNYHWKHILEVCNVTQGKSSTSVQTFTSLLTFFYSHQHDTAAQIAINDDNNVHGFEKITWRTFNVNHVV
jgi:hypothetical protein